MFWLLICSQRAARQTLSDDIQAPIAQDVHIKALSMLLQIYSRGLGQVEVERGRLSATQLVGACKLDGCSTPIAT